MDSGTRNRLNQKAYELIARKYGGDEPVEEDPVFRQACRDVFVRELQGKNVLEVGCGPGVDSAHFFEQGLEVIATDFSEEFISIVRERYPSLRAHQMDMLAPDYPPMSFNGIYAFASYIHIPRSEAARALFGFRRMLKDPGVLFLMLIESSKHREYVIEDWGGEPGNPVLFTCYSPSEIVALLEAAGFDSVQFHHIESDVYKNMPRLVERGVAQYQVMAFTK